MKPSHRMLTGEIFGSFVALSFAWSGMGGWPLEPSYLHLVLKREGEAWLWAIVIGIPALVLLVVSLREYLAFTDPPEDPMKRWSIFQLERSARIRAWCDLTMSASWAYMFKVMMELSVLRETANGEFGGVRANAILPIALFGCLCMFYSWLENKRVQRDVRKHASILPANPTH